ncbi:MAG: SdpI family protein [Firmicutes bacterium]|uniref:Uncharacterized membrane protein n=1 Tax=Melghirimyces thermohalophilus TaxID=1236220 RepID=A0A1G6MJK8_9BACL|nr:SdpI family protein [Melghirimyces thermohalophilus]MDA8354061.1 SdpI family protein [Bacillota bacterium]SDC55474.1 Uncharacterized membrane protein [Melghirimyces thermohalophilus]
MKKWTRWDTVVLILGMIPLVFAWTVYDQLPERIPSHFNLSGEPDDYSDKATFIPLMAGMGLGLPFLIKWLPALDPRKENYRKFTSSYELFRVALTGFLGGIFIATLLYALGYPVDLSQVVPVGIGLLWMVLGNFLGRIRSNYFFGIKLPWTLENEEVWRKTHRFSGPVWMGAGMVIVVSAFLPPWVRGGLIFVAILLTILLPVGYAYRVYRKIHQES